MPEHAAECHGGDSAPATARLRNRGSHHQAVSSLVSIRVHHLVRQCRRALGALCMVLSFVALAAYANGAEQESLFRPFSGDPARQLSEGATSTEEVCTRHSPGSTMEGTLCFIIVSFLVACFLEHFNHILPDHIRMPISVVLIIMGMFAGIFFLRVDAVSGLETFFAGMEGASYLDPHAIFYILLPPLLFESASSMDWRIFRKVFRSSVLLALPGVVLNTLFTGCFARAVLKVRKDGHLESVSWEAALLLSSILSATDPVAVVAALHELGAPKKLATLIEGESLLNDGSAVVFFFVFLDMVADNSPDSQKQCVETFPDNSGCLLLYFIRLSLGGPLLGAFLGMVLFYWIGLLRARHLPELEVALVIVTVYLTFYLAESTHVSGVLAVVALGVVVSAAVEPHMSHDGRHAHHFVLKQVGYMCNQIIFFAAGIVSARFMWTKLGCTETLFESARAWFELIALYLCIHFTRGAVVLLLSPLLRRWGYGITWKEAAILIWGGLRGAVGLALGLIVEHDEHVDAPVAAMVAFHVSGICLLTLLINGTTVDNFYRRLEPYPSNPFRKKYLRNVLFLLEDVCKAAFVNRLAGDWFFEDLEYDPLTKCVPNLADVEFNSAGIPHPNEASTVVETLGNLEASAGTVHSTRHNAQRGKAMLRRKDTWIGDEPLSHASPLFKNLNKNVAVDPHEKDLMINVQSSGDQYLESAPTGGSGLYVSARPLNVVCDVGEDSEAPAFSVKVHTTSVPIMIGLCWSNEVNSDHDGREKELLGSTKGTVSLDCLSGAIRLNGPNGPETLATSVTDISEGDEVVVSVVPVEEEDQQTTPTSATELEVIFELIRIADDSSNSGDSSSKHGGVKRPPALDIEEPPERIFIGKCPLYGNADVSAIHPAIQFLEMGQTAALFRRGSFKDLVAQVTQSPVHMTHAVTKNLGLRMRLNSAASLQNSRSGHMSNGSSTSKVMLSFELQTASLQETTQQLFRVMFNTVSQVYRDFHERGLIGSGSLSCLQEAVGEALDCAENELHHATLGDYSEFEAFATKSASSLTCSREAMRKRVKEAAARADRRSYMVLFEPAIVEFLALEESSSTQTIAERLPILSRQAGYMRTLCQVESLWAFVEAHNKVLNGSAALRRFPDLLDCLSIITEQAKAQVSTLSIQLPRRCFYAKHFLALRMLLSQKLEALQNFTSEGWLSLEDGEALREALWDRVKEVDCFVPRRGAARKGSQASSAPSFMSPDISEEVSPLQVVPSPSTDSAPSPVGANLASPGFGRARLEATFGTSSRKNTFFDDESVWRQNFAKLVGLDRQQSSVGTASNADVSHMLDSASLAFNAAHQHTPQRSYTARPRVQTTEALPTPTAGFSLRSPKPLNTVTGASPSASAMVHVPLMVASASEPSEFEAKALEFNSPGSVPEEAPAERLAWQTLEGGGDAAAGSEARPPAAAKVQSAVRTPDGRSPVLPIDGYHGENSSAS